MVFTVRRRFSFAFFPVRPESIAFLRRSDHDSRGRHRLPGRLGHYCRGKGVKTEWTVNKKVLDFLVFFKPLHRILTPSVLSVFVIRVARHRFDSIEALLMLATASNFICMSNTFYVGRDKGLQYELQNSITTVTTCALLVDSNDIDAAGKAILRFTAPQWTLKCSMPI